MLRASELAPGRRGALRTMVASRAIFVAMLVVHAEASCPGGNSSCSCFLRGGVSVANCDSGTAFDTWLLNRKSGTWTAHMGANCYSGHGATWAPGDLSITNKTTYTLATCKAACKSSSKCDAVTVGDPPPPPPPAPCPGGIQFNPGEQIAGPTSPSNVSAWRTAMNEWQSCVRSEMDYSTAYTAYDVPELKWTQTSYIQPQMHPYDRLFFDPVQDNYTVQRWLDDVNARYGGVDSILMWPTCKPFRTLSFISHPPQRLCLPSTFAEFRGTCNQVLLPSLQ